MSAVDNADLNFETIRDICARHGARLVAVSKTQAPERLLPLYAQGQRSFGENRVQELMSKRMEMPHDVEWHLIGSLQRNKVKYIAPFIAMIHSVTGEALLREIDRHAGLVGRTIPCLLQIHIAREETKAGLTPDEARALALALAANPLPHVRIEGLMGMATFTNDMAQIRAEFRSLRRLFESLRDEQFAQHPHFRELSMGMSGDWEIALDEGATLVRIGSLLFGSR
ncbi:MAG: YggS family pyridoxal phosphate-dependent enzyme [Saprospiraceae bacterium]